MKPIRLLLLSALLAATYGLSAQNPRLHVIERINSTGCGECPCLDSIIYKCIIPAFPNTVVLQYHSFASMLRSKDFYVLYDSLFSDRSDIRTDRDGRFYGWSFFKNIHQVCDTAVKYLPDNPDGEVVINLISKVYDPVTRTLNFSAKFTPYLTDLSGNFMVNAVITENNIIKMQEHMDTCGTPPDSIGWYPSSHMDVSRKMAFVPFGNLLAYGNWLKTQTFIQNFSFTLDTSWIASHCNIILYVYKQEDRLYNSAILQAVKESVSWPLGINERTEIQTGEIKIIPNPAGNYANAHISLPESGIARIAVVDLSGRVVKKITDVRIERDSYNVEFDLGSVSSGQYVFQVLLNGKTWSQKFTVIK